MSNFTIFPNPAKEKITISTSELTGKTIVTMYTINGKKVIEQQINNTDTQVVISSLPRGVYIVRLCNDKTVEAGKIIKQ